MKTLYLAAVLVCLTLAAGPPPLPSATNSTKVIRMTNAPGAKYKPDYRLPPAELRLNKPTWVKIGTTNHFTDRNFNRQWIDYPAPPAPRGTNTPPKVNRPAG